MSLPPAAEFPPAGRRGRLDRLLADLERLGNRLPDPAALFLVLLLVVWVLSALLASVPFSEIDPRTGRPLRIENQLTGPALAHFLATMVPTFTGFHPLGVVLVALLGVGVAEQVGLIAAGIRGLVAVTSKGLLTPVVMLMAIVSHTAADVGFVLVIPIGGLVFHAAGRHPLAGIAAAFAGVSGGLSANFIPCGLDPLLQGLTQSAAQIVDPARTVNPLCNWLFTTVSSVLVIAVGWYLTDRVLEPRLKNTPVDDDAIAAGQGAEMRPLSSREKRGLGAALGAAALGLVALGLAVSPADSALRAPDGALTGSNAPLMQAMVPLIFFLFLIPGMVYGYVAKTVSSHRDLVGGMSRTMGTMGYYIVLAFFAALFIAAFGRSNLGALLALKGAALLQSAGMPAQVTIVGVVALTAIVNLFVGSASAKWALLAPIFVPMLMQLGISPELTQAAYRVGDSTTNIITPLMPYFPLVVAFSQRYVKKTGIGTLAAAMLPYSITFLVAWSLFLVLFWVTGIPLGIQGVYTYP